MTAALNSLTGRPTQSEYNALLLNLSLPGEAAATVLLQQAIAEREQDLNRFLDTENLSSLKGASDMRVALMDMWFQAPTYFRHVDQHQVITSLTNLTLDLRSGNRAAAWFEIRYRSSVGGAGIIARRYVDSQLFGLYEDPTHATSAEALQAYQLLTAKRPVILQYEDNNGTDPFSANPLAPSQNIGQANSTYGLTGTDNEVQTLRRLST